MSERRASTGKIAVFAVLAVALAAAGGTWLWSGSPASAEACQAKQGALSNFQPAETRAAVPDTPFKDEHGKDRRLSEHRGRGVVLNFWATWCAPCVREMPQLERLKALVAENGVDVLTVSEDRKGVPLVKKFYAVNKLHDLDIRIDEGGKLLRALKGRGLPTTVLIDKTGMEVGRVVGVAEWDAAEAVTFIRECLGD